MTQYFAWWLSHCWSLGHTTCVQLWHFSVKTNKIVYFKNQISHLTPTWKNDDTANCENCTQLYEFKLEILILVVLPDDPYSLTMAFLIWCYSYSNTLLPITHFNTYHMHVFFSCGENAVNWGSCVGRIFCTDLVLGLYN